MRPEREIKAAGIAVSHCPALLSQGEKDVDLVPEFGRLGERLARALAPALVPFCAGKAPDVRLAATDRTGAGDLAGKILPLAANSILSLPGEDHVMILSIDGAGVIAQLDRALGGTGQLAGDLPRTLPLSADMLAQRIEHAVADLLGQLIERDGPMAVKARDNSFSGINPYRKADALVVLSFEISDGAAPWFMTLATKAEALPAFVSAPGAKGQSEPRKSGPLDNPFAGVPLTLEAILAEMRVPLSRLATLEAGQTIPIPVARAVPLRVGGTIIAKGTVGELEDRVALQLTSSMISRKDPQ